MVLCYETYKLHKNLHDINTIYTFSRAKADLAPFEPCFLQIREGLRFGG